MNCEILFGIRVVVDDLGDIDDEPDAQLRNVVCTRLCSVSDNTSHQLPTARGSLARKEHHASVDLLALCGAHCLESQVALYGKKA